MNEIALSNGVGLLRSNDSAVEIWLRALHEEFAAPLYRYALALTCSVEDAQDAVQEVFTRISRQPKRFTEVKNVRAYLYSAARNAAYSILRGRMRSEALHEAICADIALIFAPESRQMSATIIVIREAMEQLSIEQREVLVLKILNQMTFQEIAKTVHASVNTVAGRYRYGTEKLRRAIKMSDEV